MPTFLVELKRVTYSTARVEAKSAAEARKIVEADGPHEHMISAEISGTDTTTIASVKPETTRG